ncbi:MAG: hypothetical protein OXC95_04340 [Dehalococcoidia bacterium]|nr:hypothetical protein [Dehalococcoidia bacterium]
MESVESRMATKDDLARTEKNIRSDMATKDDLARVEKNMSSELARTEKSIRSEMSTQDVVDRIESQLNQLRDDIGPLKDAHTMGAAIREADLIAEEMGFRFVRVLERKDIRMLVNGKGLPDASSDDLKSFRRADLIMEVSDLQGEVAYIAAEVSFTADERDTSRAIRNAEYMTKLTGKEARAAIVGLRRDNRIERMAQNDVFWYGLPQSSVHSD